MANHEPLMGSLVTGAVIVEAEDGARTTIGVHGGFLQVLDNQVTLITDRAQITEGGREEAVQVAEQLAAEHGKSRGQCRSRARARAPDSHSPATNSSTVAANPLPMAEAMTGKKRSRASRLLRHRDGPGLSCRRHSAADSIDTLPLTSEESMFRGHQADPRPDGGCRLPTYFRPPTSLSNEKPRETAIRDPRWHR